MPAGIWFGKLGRGSQETGGGKILKLFLTVDLKLRLKNIWSIQIY
jgi:hypothetical protein